MVQLLSVVLGLSALAAGGAAIANSVAGAWRPAWFTFGFELVTLFAAVFGVAAGRGRSVPGISTAVTIACVAGSVAIASLFGYLAAGRTLFGIGLLPLLGLRFAIAGALAVVACSMVLSADRRSFFLIAKGTALILLSAAVAAGIWLGRPRLAAISDELLMGVVVAGFCVVTGLLAAGIHWVVGAFTLATAHSRTTS